MDNWIFQQRWLPKRVRCAIHVLQGHPLAYRMQIDAVGPLHFSGQRFWVMECVLNKRKLWLQRAAEAEAVA